MAPESITERVERSQADQERRDARDRWREHGGSRRRPLHSFRTAEENAEIRAEHAETVADAIRAVSTPDGARAFLVSRSLNPHLSAGNAAIAAHVAPGCVVGTVAHWRTLGYRVRKGESAGSFRLTGPPKMSYFPIAAFAHPATDWPADDLEPMIEDAEPDPATCELVAWGVAQALRSRKPNARIVSEVAKRLDAIYAPAPERQAEEDPADLFA